MAGVDRPLEGGARARHLALVGEQDVEVTRRLGRLVGVAGVDRPLVGGARARHVALAGEQDS